MTADGLSGVLARTGPWSERPVGQRWAIRLVWIAFVAFPLVSAASSPAPALTKAAVIVAAVLFVAGYVALVAWQRGTADRVAATVLAAMLALASFITSVEGTGWSFLFVYCAACCGLLRGSRLGFAGVSVSAVLAGVVSILAGGSAGEWIGYAASAAGVGMLMLLIRDLRFRNEELSEARAELARVAVARERERFARDLHDLLGHSLSVIAIKAELARRLVAVDGERAAGEVADIEAVARQALAEVRDAVSGYRRPSLSGELEGARVALEAAGIAATIEPGSVVVDGEREAVLAWAVREGATNVIRHSAARRCSVRVLAREGGAVVEVSDDGAVVDGAPGPGVASAGGHGLDGLRERVKDVGGTLDAGPRAGGGYRLTVSVPAAAVPA